MMIIIKIIQHICGLCYSPSSKMRKYLGTVASTHKPEATCCMSPVATKDISKEKKLTCRTCLTTSS